MATDELRRGYCYDFGAGYAEVDCCFDTAPLGVALNLEGCGVLNASQCRMLASFLSRAADWLDKTRANSGFPNGTMVYVLSDGTGHYKVGKAVNIAARIKQLQTGNGRKLSLHAYLPCSDERAAYRVETYVKRWLEPYKATGEWFECESQTVVIALCEAAEEIGLSYSPIEMRQEATDGR